MKPVVCIAVCILWSACDRASQSSPEWSTILPLKQSLCFAKDARFFWISTNEGLYRIGKESGDTVFLPVSGEAFPTALVLSSAAADSGRIWFGTGAGLWLVDSVTIRTWDSENSGLPNNVIRDIAVAQDGSLWIATGSGVVHKTGESFTLYSTGNSNLPSNDVTSVAVLQNGDVWAGTWGNGLAVKNGDAWEAVPMNETTLRSPYVFTVKSVGNVLWVGEGGGLDRLKSGNWKNFNSLDDPLPQNDVTCLAPFDDNHVWLGTYEGGVAEWDNPEWAVFDPENSPLTQLRIISVFKDSDDLWVGSYRGIFKIRHASGR